MKWIPVTERLPQEPVRVLATVEDIGVGEPYIVDCLYTRETDPETGEIYGDATFVTWTGEGYMKLNDCNPYRTTAWMPMPDPYKGEFKVIVAGSRTFDDYNLLCQKLDKILNGAGNVCIVCGEAKGADQLGKRYAKEHRLKVESYPANWEKFGKQAGYIRNEKMASVANALVAFWNGSSAGTKHMIETAKKMGLQVRVIKFDERTE